MEDLAIRQLQRGLRRRPRPRSHPTAPSMALDLPTDPLNIQHPRWQEETG